MNFFGTDGIRGTYGSTITDGTAFLLGKSLAILGGESPVVVVGRDTRLSGGKLFNALASGVYSSGGNVLNVGVLPTNAVGFTVRQTGADFGVMISASHNPPSDNGLKVFDRYGVKICGEREKQISDCMLKLVDTVTNVGKVNEPLFENARNLYVNSVVKSVGVDLHGISIALDCCYGASTTVARQIFESAGANVTVTGAKADGKRINVDCGATCPWALGEKMRDGCFDLGFSFDGDADRLAVFEKQSFVPNDKVFYCFARYLHEQNLLNKSTAVGTVLTNGGVEKALGDLGIALVRTSVGDVNVLRKMFECGYNFGGEESGHYLLSDYAFSSDALINAMFACKVFRECGSLLNYSKACEPLPFVKRNFALNDNVSDEFLQDVSERIGKLYPSTRTVLRKSGTEPVIRAYAEGENCQNALDQIAVSLGGGKNPLTV